MSARTRVGSRVLAMLALGVAISLHVASPAVAIGSGTWDGLKTDVFGARAIESGFGVVTLKAPFRPDDQRAVPISIDARFADGRTVKSVTLIVDENPSPVAAVFTFHVAKRSVGLKTNFRLNQETHVRAVVEASDGKLYMAQQLVKFAGGQAACSAPPTGDPAEIAANMGKMRIANVPVASAGRETTANSSSIVNRVRLEVSHPNHTGMALDQQTLLYIPLRMITDLEVSQGGVKLFGMTGSITISENPAFEFDVDLTREHRVVAKLKDSNGAEWQREIDLPAGS